MSKVDGKLISTPVPDLCGDPGAMKQGAGTWDGVSGYPERTSSPNAVPEKMIDGSFGPKGKE